MSDAPFRAPGPREPHRRPGRLPRRLDRLDGDRPRRPRRARAARRRAHHARDPTSSTVTVDVAADGQRRAARRRARRGAARSPASHASSPSSAARRRAPTLEVDLERADRRGPVVERRVRGRVHARTVRRRRLRARRARRSRSPRNAPSTSRPACRAASRTRWPRCTAGPTHAIFLDCRTLEIEHVPMPDSAARARRALRRAARRSKPPRTRSAGPRASPSPRNSGCPRCATRRSTKYATSRAAGTR